MAWAAESEKTGTLNIILENDLFYNMDQHYTNGVRLKWVPGHDVSAPDWAVRLARLVPWFPEKGKMLHGYALGQNMFTPTDIAIANSPLTERPYAGWLYCAVGLGVRQADRFDFLALSIGMVGSSSLAEQSQKFVHKIIDSAEPQGWDTQLGNEPGIVATYQRLWRGFSTLTLLGSQLDFAPHIGASIGNVLTYINSGFTMRYGRHLPDDYGPPRIQPGASGSADFSPKSDFGWYLFAGIEGRAVARNIFLDGNTFRDSRSVDKEPLVGDLQFGVVIDRSDIRISYTHVLRTREFGTQDGGDAFGAISVSFNF
jgi:hypothetical protein